MENKRRMERYTIKDFGRDFSTDDACLEWLRNFLYPDGIFCKLCQKVTKHHRVQSRPSYSCDWCGHHVHPTAGTIFEKSVTPLRSWFHAVYLMASTRCGISAKQLERELGVTYKTAWRIFNKIRSLLSEDGVKLSGHVEMDETYIGGRRSGKRGRGAEGKAPVAGIVERKGRIIARKVINCKAKTLMPLLRDSVARKSAVYTDELGSYNRVARYGYEHFRIPHAAKVYVIGDTHTNTVDGFWSLLKRGIKGVYHAVSHKHLQSYIDEYAFRYNHRNDEKPMFKTFLSRVSKA